MSNGLSFVAAVEQFALAVDIVDEGTKSEFGLVLETFFESQSVAYYEVSLDGEKIGDRPGLRSVWTNEEPTTWPIGEGYALHLRETVTARRVSCVTGQFPIYAKQTGLVEGLLGREAAIRNPSVHDVRSAVPKEGLTFMSADRENYVGFVSLVSDSHESVRRASYEVAGMLSVKWLDGYEESN